MVQISYLWFNLKVQSSISEFYALVFGQHLWSSPVCLYWWWHGLFKRASTYLLPEQLASHGGFNTPFVWTMLISTLHRPGDCVTWEIKRKRRVHHLGLLANMMQERVFQLNSHIQDSRSGNTIPGTTCSSSDDLATIEPHNSSTALCRTHAQNASTPFATETPVAFSRQTREAGSLFRGMSIEYSTVDGGQLAFLSPA